jgi:hypothetical protein
LRFELPVVSWTSADGRQWTPHLLPTAWFSTPTGIAPLFAAGPAGLIVASRGTAGRVATSTDGSHWKLSPAGGFPQRFALDDLRGTTRGYVATGRWVTGDARTDAAALSSVDGRHWSDITTLLPVSPGSTPDGPGVTTLVGGRDGLIAIGRRATSLDAALWWQSSDGRRWRFLDGYPPLGALSPDGAKLPGPHGELVGDGGRLVAVRGGPQAIAWVSRDGLAWQELTMSGDLPSALATRATLLPGGVLLSDGSATWFGEAVVG